MIYKMIYKIYNIYIFSFSYTYNLCSLYVQKKIIRINEKWLEE